MSNGFEGDIGCASCEVDAMGFVIKLCDSCKRKMQNHEALADAQRRGTGTVRAFVADEKNSGPPTVQFDGQAPIEVERSAAQPGVPVFETAHVPYDQVFRDAAETAEALPVGGAVKVSFDPARPEGDETRIGLWEDGVMIGWVTPEEHARHERLKSRIAMIDAMAQRELALLEGVEGHEGAQRRRFVGAQREMRHAMEHWHFELGTIPQEDMADVLFNLGGDFFASGLLCLKHVSIRIRAGVFTRALGIIIQKLIRQKLIPPHEQLQEHAVSKLVDVNGKPFKR